MRRPATSPRPTPARRCARTTVKRRWPLSVRGGGAESARDEVSGEGALHDAGGRDVRGVRPTGLRVGAHEGRSLYSGGAGYFDGAPAHARLLPGRRRRVVDFSIRAAILEWAVGHRARAVPDRGRRRPGRVSSDGERADARRSASCGEGRAPPGLPAVAELDTVTREARGV